MCGGGACVQPICETRRQRTRIAQKQHFELQLRQLRGALGRHVGGGIRERTDTQAGATAASVAQPTMVWGGRGGGLRGGHEQMCRHTPAGWTHGLFAHDFTRVDHRVPHQLRPRRVQRDRVRSTRSAGLLVLFDVASGCLCASPSRHTHPPPGFSARLFYQVWDWPPCRGLPVPHRRFSYQGTASNALSCLRACSMLGSGPLFMWWSVLE
jgi:hypothetical protein